MQNGSQACPLVPGGDFRRITTLLAETSGASQLYRLLPRNSGAGRRCVPSVKPIAPVSWGRPRAAVLVAECRVGCVSCGGRAWVRGGFPSLLEEF